MTKEVDDVEMKPMSTTPVIDLPSCVAAEHSAHTAPVASLQGTAVPCGRAWTAVAPVLVQVAFGARVTTDLPGSPPRGAPV